MIGCPIRSLSVVSSYMIGLQARLFVWLAMVYTSITNIGPSSVSSCDHTGLVRYRCYEAAEYKYTRDLPNEYPGLW